MQPTQPFFCRTYEVTTKPDATGGQRKRGQEMLALNNGNVKQTRAYSTADEPSNGLDSNTKAYTSDSTHWNAANGNGSHHTSNGQPLSTDTTIMKDTTTTLSL